LFNENLKTIALFGGSFDPPHFGHKMVVDEALKVLKIDKLIVVPTFLNPFKTASYFTAEERFVLTKELFKEFYSVVVDEYEIKEEKPTPTVQTLRHFEKFYNVDYIIVGADNLENIEKWQEFEYLNSKITWVVASRAGYGFKSDKLRAFKRLNVEVDMSSTQIRNEMTKESL
jgi:nicotinate-nucleotide adenylyltransferase